MEENLEEELTLTQSVRRENFFITFTIIFSSVIMCVAILLGFLYPVTNLTYESSVSTLYNQYEYSFNFPLTIATIIANIILTYFMLAIGSIITEIRILNKTLNK